MRKNDTITSESENGTIADVATPPAENLNLTPSSKAKADLAESNIDGRKLPKLRKNVTMLYAMLDEAKNSSTKKTSIKSGINPLKAVSRKVVKKYRLMTAMSRELKVNRKKMQPSNEGDMTVPKKRRLPELNIKLRRLILSSGVG